MEKWEKIIKDIKIYDKIFIFLGGSGFIGSNLIDHFRKENMIFNFDKVLNSHTVTYSNIIDIELDLSQEKSKLDPLINLLEVLKQEKLLYKVNIFHLASTVGPHNITLENCKKDFDINFNIYSILKDLEDPKNTEDKINKLIYTSTSEVYGDKEIHLENSPVEYLPKNIRGLYTLQKLTGETLFLDKNLESIKDVVVTRLFNVIGANQKEGFIFSNFLNILLYNISHNEVIKKYKIYGEGTQSRTFIDIKDLVNVMSLLIDYIKYPKPLKNKNNQILNNIINIANISNKMTALELAKQFIDIQNHILGLDKDLGYNNFIKFLDTTNSDKDLIGQQDRNPITYKLYKVLKYQPKNKINDIIISSIQERLKDDR